MKRHYPRVVRRAASPSAILLAAVLVGATPALAASPVSDTDFLQQALHTESAETQIGQLAVEKGSSDGVRKLGQMLVEDHAATSQEASRLANTMQVSLTVSSAGDQEATYKSLQGLSGSGFDNAFINAVIKSSKSAIAQYEAQAEGGDGAVSAYADKTLPVLERHLRMARMLKMRTQEHNTP